LSKFRSLKKAAQIYFKILPNTKKHSQKTFEPQAQKASKKPKIGQKSPRALGWMMNEIKPFNPKRFNPVTKKPPVEVVCDLK
jgi:hypothetical protein